MVSWHSKLNSVHLHWDSDFLQHVSHIRWKSLLWLRDSPPPPPRLIQTHYPVLWWPACLLLLFLPRKLVRHHWIGSALDTQNYLLTAEFVSSILKNTRPTWVNTKKQSNETSWVPSICYYRLTSRKSNSMLLVITCHTQIKAFLCIINGIQLILKEDFPCPQPWMETSCLCAIY